MPGGHGYDLNVRCLFIWLVQEGVSLRCASRVLSLIAGALGWSQPIPHWTTGRLWLLRFGHAALTQPVEDADDWAWLIDHSVQIGKQKCLLILGIRLRDLPPQGQALEARHMRMISLAPRPSWTRAEVDAELEACAQRTCVPRVIVNDHGVDLHGGVELFRGRHPEVSEIYDTKHKAACLLKHRLEKNPRWQEFSKRVGQTRCAIQQTELGFLVPPAPKPKARFMNLDATLRWADNTLAVVRHPNPQTLEATTPARLQEKLGWLEDYAADIAEWSQWQTLTNVTVEFVNRQGVFRGATRLLRAELRPHQTHESSRQLAKDLRKHVTAQSLCARAGERLPGSTEILESVFGRFKQLEKQQARGGFTSLVLAFGAFVGDQTAKAIQHAMERSPTKSIYEWCREHLGTTLFSQRKQAFNQKSATEFG